MTQQVWNSYRDLKRPGFTTLAFLSCENILQNYALMITAQGLCSFDWWVDLNELRLMRKHNLWMEIKTAARPSFSDVEPKSKVMLQILCAETLIYWWKRPQNKRQNEQKSCRWAAHFQLLSEVANFFSSSGCPSALLLDLKYCLIICFCFHKNHLPSSCWSPYCYHSIKNVWLLLQCAETLQLVLREDEYVIVSSVIQLSIDWKKEKKKKRARGTKPDT